MEHILMAMPCPKSCSELLLDKPQALHTDKDLSSLFTTPRKLFLVKHLFFNPGMNNKPMKENKPENKAGNKGFKQFQQALGCREAPVPVESEELGCAQTSGDGSLRGRAVRRQEEAP